MRSLLVQGGAAGARALCAARMAVGPKQSGGRIAPSARARFIDALHAIGKHAHPAVTAVLASIQPDVNRLLDADLAVDMLRALPDEHDDEAGTLVSKFLRPNLPAIVCAAAVHAIAIAWGARARPLVTGMLDSSDDGIRLAALESLARIDGLDDGALGRIEKILNAEAPASDEVRVAAAEALGRATPARAAGAAAVLHRTLARKPKLMSFLRSNRDAEAPNVLLACARALVTIDRAGCRASIVARAERTEDLRLRAQLMALAPPG
jgi:hypothetical protein